MTQQFSDIIKKKSDKELLKIVINYSDYQDIFIGLAKEELKARGISLTENQINEIEQKKKKDIEKQEDEVKFREFIFGGWSKYVVKDNDVPKIYTFLQIIICSGLFSCLSGGILLVINLYKLKKMTPIRVISIFLVSIIVTSIYVVLLYNSFDPNRFDNKINMRTLGIFNLFVTTGIFASYWWKYIGGDFKHQSQSNLIPIILGIIAVTFFLLRNSIINLIL